VIHPVVEVEIELARVIPDLDRIAAQADAPGGGKLEDVARLE
jgi:hypothetical protein